LTGGQLDPATFRSKLNGIANKIYKHLFESRGVGVNMQVGLNLLE
jgi:hypothetical protein